MSKIIEDNLELLKRYYLSQQIEDMLSCNEMVTKDRLESINCCSEIVFNVNDVDSFIEMLEMFGYDELEEDTLEKAMLFNNVD